MHHYPPKSINANYQFYHSKTATKHLFSHQPACYSIESYPSSVFCSRGATSRARRGTVLLVLQCPTSITIMASFTTMSALQLHTLSTTLFKTDCLLTRRTLLLSTITKTSLTTTWATKTSTTSRLLLTSISRGTTKTTTLYLSGTKNHRSRATSIHVTVLRCIAILRPKRAGRAGTRPLQTLCKTFCHKYSIRKLRWALQMNLLTHIRFQALYIHM